MLVTAQVRLARVPASDSYCRRLILVTALCARGLGHLEIFCVTFVGRAIDARRSRHDMFGQDLSCCCRFHSVYEDPDQVRVQALQLYAPVTRSIPRGIPQTWGSIERDSWELCCMRLNHPLIKSWVIVALLSHEPAGS